MEETSHLYLLVFPARKMIKIGKANNIYNRIQALKKYWGEVDYENSYRLVMPQGEVFKLEKTLHYLLAQYQTGTDAGDGYTELFSADALAPALRHISHFTEHQIITSTLQKGIEIPKLLPRTVKKGKSPYFKKKEQAQAMIASVGNIVAQFNKINRLLLILIYKQHRLRYQYNIENNEVLFRIIDDGEHLIDSTTVMRMFSFFIKDYRYWGGTNYCTGVCSSGNVTQYSVALLANRSEPHPLVAYLWSQTESIFKQLPQRSSLLTEDIPVLDDREVLREILQQNVQE